MTKITDGNIKTVLIANRGEIAVRVIRTCKRLGIRTVAVYSEPDRYSPHVAQADEGVLIGPGESSQSYLSAEAIIIAAQRTGADAIHPGYGFLSESETLIAACERENITFIGPHREAIRLMGSKIESKSLADKAGVATIPGYHSADQSESTLVNAAEKIGFPIMIKASAGGGGRGMRRIDSSEQLIEELPQAKQEALSGFADDSVLLEKLISSPRHIEVQLAADKLGNIIHLFERECSIQRNHQKVIEEAPAAFLNEQQRTQLYRDAIILGQSINYDSLGTVEFLLDQDTGEIYFLEMNTRLQVEHPVTEAITGLDLVEWQIRIAAGEPLPATQEQIIATGWAIEARINAEDPADNYRPETGTITRYRDPSSATVRVDSGVTLGSVITPYYDPMLAKVIGRGADREQARQALLSGLGDFVLSGIGTNLEFLSSIVRHEKFSASALNTNYIKNSFPNGWQKQSSDNTLLLCAAVASAMSVGRSHGDKHLSPWQSLSSFRVLKRAGQIGQSRVVLITPEGNTKIISIGGCAGVYQASVVERDSDDAEANTGPNTPYKIQSKWLDDEVLQVEIDGVSRQLSIDFLDEEIILHWAGQTFSYQALDEQQLILSSGGNHGSSEHRVLASLPGQVTEVKVSVGDQVNVGDTLVVLDSMKLLHSLNAQTDGTVKEIFCAEGDNVEGGAILIELAPGKPA